MYPVASTKAMNWRFVTGVTSIQKLLGRPVPLAEVESAVTDAFLQVFDRTLSGSGQ